MATALLVIHIIIAIALIVSVLLQRSEGGALGIGGGGSMMSGRSSANTMTKVTAALAACFFLTSIGLTILGRTAVQSGSKIDNIKIEQPVEGEDKAGTENKGDNNTDGKADTKSDTPSEPVIPAP